MRSFPRRNHGSAPGVPPPRSRLSRFGERCSHGCVNLGPSDARWLFYWTTPFVPEGWHGVNAHEGAPGSLVVVH